MATINEIVGDPFNERALGCILGAMAADSCGSYLELYGGFEDHQLMIASDKVMDDCMTMPGGGIHQVASGQVTDDSELMQCLLWGYVESNLKDENPRVFDLNAVAKRFGMWYNSKPFDIGNATTNGV